MSGPQLRRRFSVPILCSIGMICLYVMGEMLYIPDGYELAILSDCIDGSSFVDCSSIHMGFRPPLMSILAWPFGWEGIPFLSIMSLAITAAIIGFYCRSHTVWIAVLSLFCTQNYPIISDARSLLPSFLFGGWLMMAKEDRSSKEVLFMSFLIGLGIWIRPEAILGIFLFVPYALFFYMKHRYWILLGVAIPTLLWIIWLSYLAETWVWSPRYWEGYMLASWELMPKRLMLQLGGMGIYNTPMREVWMDSPILSSTTTLEFNSFLSWMAHVFSRNWILWSTGLISLGYLLSIRSRVGWILIAIFCINLLAALIPQARDPAFVESNFLLSQIALISAVALCSVQIWPNQKLISYILPIIIVFINPSHDIERGLEDSKIGASSIAWIQENSTQDSLWVSSYENAPLLWRAQRDWKQWNDPWHPIDTPHYRITTNFDAFDVGLPLCPKQKLKAYFSTSPEKREWISIYFCSP